MNRLLITLSIIGTFGIFLSSCKPTKKIQTAIAKKDTAAVVVTNLKEDSIRLMNSIYEGVVKNHIDFNTFSAKINVDYVDGDDKSYNVNAFVRMQKDSTIWISVNAIFGIEALRALITKDSVKILDKQNKVYTARAVSYLQDVTALPLNLSTLQDLIIGNPIFIDSNMVSYERNGNAISIIMLGEWFKTLMTVNEGDMTVQRIKLDDAGAVMSRTCDITYSDYENKKGVNFPTIRRISIVEKKKLDIKMEFKQYEFNESLTFPFAVPKNYKTQ